MSKKDLPEPFSSEELARRLNNLDPRVRLYLPRQGTSVRLCFASQSKEGNYTYQEIVVYSGPASVSRIKRGTLKAHVEQYGSELERFANNIESMVQSRTPRRGCLISSPYRRFGIDAWMEGVWTPARYGDDEAAITSFPKLTDEPIAHLSQPDSITLVDRLNRLDVEDEIFLRAGRFSLQFAGIHEIPGRGDILTAQEVVSYRGPLLVKRMEPRYVQAGQGGAVQLEHLQIGSINEQLRIDLYTPGFNWMDKGIGDQRAAILPVSYFPNTLFVCQAKGPNGKPQIDYNKI